MDKSTLPSRKLGNWETHIQNHTRQGFEGVLSFPSKTGNWETG